MPDGPATAAIAALHSGAQARPAVASPVEEEVVALFDEFRAPLIRYLLSFGLTVPDSEEVIQEVFLSLFLHLRSGKSRENLRGWLFRVAHNLALKRRQRDRRNFPDAIPDDTAVDPSPNPEAQFFNLQSQRRCLAVVEALPERDRRCLWLRAEGLRYREIAAVLDISLGAVALSLTRSLARIARATEL